MMSIAASMLRWSHVTAVMLAIPSFTLAAETVVVTLDQAKLTKAPERTATVVVGNPLIADVSVQAGGRIIVITGKGYGVTNLIVLDRNGQVLAEQLVQVRSPANNVVVYRGATVRESYNCAPYCEPRITLGDKSRRFPEFYFDGLLDETLERNVGAQRGEGGGGGGAGGAER
jgi:putative type II/III system pilus formation protein